MCNIRASSAAHRRAIGAVEMSQTSYWRRVVRLASTNGCISAGKRHSRMGPGDHQIGAGENVLEIALTLPWQYTMSANPKRVPDAIQSMSAMLMERRYGTIRLDVFTESDDLVLVPNYPLWVMR